MDHIIYIYIRDNKQITWSANPGNAFIESLSSNQHEDLWFCLSLHSRRNRMPKSLSYMMQSSNREFSSEENLSEFSSDVVLCFKPHERQSHQSCEVEVHSPGAATLQQMKPFLYSKVMSYGVEVVAGSSTTQKWLRWAQGSHDKIPTTPTGRYQDPPTRRCPLSGSLGW